jgi:hypothetical protein
MWNREPKFQPVGLRERVPGKGRKKERSRGGNWKGKDE